MQRLVLTLSLLSLVATGCDDDRVNTPRKDPDARRGRPLPLPGTPTPMPVPTALGPCSTPNTPVMVTDNQMRNYSGLDELGAYLSFALASNTGRNDEFRIDIYDHMYDLDLGGALVPVDDFSTPNKEVVITGFQADPLDCTFCVSLRLQEGTRLMATAGTATVQSYLHNASGSASGAVKSIVFKEVDKDWKFVKNGCQLNLPVANFAGILPDWLAIYAPGKNPV